MAEQYADKQIKLFSLTANREIAEKFPKLQEFLWVRCHHVNSLMAKL